MVSLPRLAARMSRTALLASAALTICSYAYAAGSGQPAGDQTKIDQLERQMQLLMRQLEELKQKQAAQQQLIEEQDRQLKAEKQEIDEQTEQVASLPPTVAPANVVTGGDKPGSFKLPGTDTSVKIGGYVKGDLIYDVNSDFGEAHTYIEGDFFGSGGDEVFSNSANFRIRHAYGELGPVLVGQTWSNFMFLDSYPDTVDFFGASGIPFARQGQLRYTYKGIENLELSVSAENSELSGLAEDPVTGDILTLGSTRQDFSDFAFGIDTLPDFTARASYLDDWGALSMSGVARLLEVDSGDGVDDEEFGWGVLAAGVLNLGQFIPALGDDSIAANFTYGDGVGRYIINGFNEDALLDGSGKLDTIESWGVAAAFTHHWTDTLRSNFVYGHYEVEDTFGSDFTESLDSIHSNLMWTPTDRIQFGLEWIYGARDFQDSGFDNDAQRVQFAGQFSF